MFQRSSSFSWVPKQVIEFHQEVKKKLEQTNEKYMKAPDKHMCWQVFVEDPTQILYWRWCRVKIGIGRNQRVEEYHRQIHHYSKITMANQTSSSHKNGEGLKNCPAKERGWRGIIEVVENGRITFSAEMSAHLSAQVSRKAFDFSFSLESKLEMNLHPRNDFYPHIFEEACPDRDDIALYIYPTKDPRSKEQYSQLLQEMTKKDLMMHICINDRELLVYPSRILVADCQTLNNNYFMWGVFRPRIDGM